MTDSQKLEEIIKTAIERGFGFVASGVQVRPWVSNGTLNGTQCYTVWIGSDVYHASDILFNHDFAKAYWGEDATYDMTHLVKPDGGYRMNARPAYQYHLQQCVLAENPISYYYDNK